MSNLPNAAITAWLDQEDAFFAEMIRQHGVCIQSVGGDPAVHQPPFAYTVGLFGVAHPELLVVGMPEPTAQAVLNDVAERVRAGRLLVPGEVLEFTGWSHRVVVEVVPNPGQIAFSANRYYRLPDDETVDLLQLTYDDLFGRFPGDDGYSRPAWLQPRPGELRA
ncbi:DUF4262 domain-containing protein [Microbacterium sp. P06]|uniref:DUF4262 domain-containing protein n=1 Tax=unclassified Microbacterium TaxID=2609290 RepID=UPI0037472B09